MSMERQWAYAVAIQSQGKLANWKNSLFSNEAFDQNSVKGFDKLGKITKEDWARFAKLIKGKLMNEDGKPKFDAVVGNPPYQTEVAIKPGQEHPTVTNIFHEFQLSAMFIAQKTSLVYPGGRWIQQSGKGVKKFGKDFINDPRLVSVDLYGNGDETPNDEKLFGVRIPDGVSIVYWNSQHDNPSTLKFNGIEVERPGDEILPVESSALSILNKIRSTSSLPNRGFSEKPLFGRELVC